MLEDLLLEAGKNIPRPFGIYLSGGLDSGILAALLKPDVAVSCHFKGEFYDELWYADMIAKHLGIRHIVVEPDGKDFQKVVAEVLRITGAKKPINSVSVYPWFKIVGAVKEMGITTMVGGEGSDETFGGYTRYLILQKIHELYEMESLAGYKPMLDSIFGSFVKVHSKLCGVPTKTLMKRYAEKKDKGIITQVGWAEFNESLTPITEMEKSINKHFGIDFYLPFYDPKVQEYGWSLDDEEKIHEDTRKLQVYCIAQKYLPEPVWNRKDKKGFICPCNEWCGAKNKYDKKKYLKLQERIIANNYELLG